MVDVTSVRNPAVTHARRLGRRRERGDDQLLVEGPGAVAAAIDAGACVELFASESAGRADAALLDRARARGATVRLASDAVIEAVATTISPQGVVAVARWPLAPVSAAVDGATLVVMGADLGDPGNVGALVRTADAAGADAVVLVDGADPRGPKAVRASAGSLFHLPVATASWPAASDAVRAAGLALVAADGAAERAHTDHDWTQASAIVLGSEAHGLAGDVRASCDAAVAVPMVGRAESLNVAVAGGVLCYEALRQRGGIAGRRGVPAPARGARP